MADPDAVRRASWAAAYQQSTAVGRALSALREQNVQGIARATLDRLVSQASAFGRDNPLLRAEAAASGCVRVPSSMIEP
jgi:hypothetical protein